MKQIYYTRWDKTKHFFGMIWFILKEMGKLLTKKWFWLVVAFIVWSWGIAWFNSNYEIKTYFKIGVYQRATSTSDIPGIAPGEQISTPSASLMSPVQASEMTEEQYALSKPHGNILWNIFRQESGRGTNDMCRKKGMGFNGLGLGESDEYIRLHGPNCFESYEKLWDRAEKLLVDLGVDKPGMQQTAICRWKYGDKYNQTMCQYSNDVLIDL